MENPLTTPLPETAEHYTIRIEGHLNPDWSEWFGDMTITLAESGETVLAGPIADQAMLHGILARIRDLNLTLIAVSRSSQTDNNGRPTTHAANQPGGAK